jgi:glycerol-3-phosphate O-acyltransferase
VSTSRAAARSLRNRASFLDRWFRPVSVPAEAPDLSGLAERGSIVFVMPSAGVLNFLFLAWLSRQLLLPPVRAALGLTGFMPRVVRSRPTLQHLEDALRRGRSAVVFLDRGSGPDPFPVLAAAQRSLGRPIFLVPALLVWSRRAQRLQWSLSDILFGTPDAPSRLANAIGFILNRERAVLRLGHPSNLADFVAERPSEPDAVVGRKLRGALHLHLAGQLRAVVGPPLKRPARMREQVLRDRGLRQALQREAQETGRPLSSLEEEAARDVREIASRYSPRFVELLRPCLRWLFGRLYDAIDIDEEGLARVKQAAADVPIVLCPSHKSYVDFLVLSWLLYERGMTPPLIAAGINLAFWPFGGIARRGGAFFIRRTLKGDRVYTATLRAYVKQLLRDRFPQEFYLEGTRSRSGKLLFPRTGLFSMEVDAWLEGAAPDVLFVPVAIDYERLLEGQSHAAELAGGEKRKESWRGLLKARKVLRARHGRLALQFEEPVSLKAFVAQRLGARAGALSLDDVMPSPTAPVSGRAHADATKRELVQALANRVAFGINRAITMTPVGLIAAALLAHLRRGLPAPEAAERIELLRYIAANNGARFSRGFPGAASDPRARGPIADAMARLASEGLVQVEQAAGEVIYQAVEERRPQLDYYKNTVLHRYVAIALVSTALRALGGDAPADAVKARTRWLSRLFKLEFMYRVNATFDELFEENVVFMLRIGVLEEAAGHLRIGPQRGALDFLADLVHPYVEAYRVAAGALLAIAVDAPAAALDRKAMVKAFLEHGRAAHAAGRVRLREAISKATFENAAEWFIQQGALAPAGATSGTLEPAWRDATLPEIARILDEVLAAAAA